MITHINPFGSMDLLSQLEVDRLKQTASSDIYQLFRNCSLAVLNSGSHTDSSKEILERFKSFDIHVIRRERGVKLELFNAPEHAFVDGEIIRGIQEHLFSVLRDILYVSNQLESNRQVNLTNSTHISNVVFAILRNAKVIQPGADPNLIVCWGGHSINEIEYQYTRAVGNELGLRELNICTGCGPGAMEGPMKGAAVGHAKQRVRNGRYIGLTEPSIIAAEPPNPIVNELVILPDIEKRLEAFVRLGHGIIIFPGGAGTAEEFLYLLGILTHPDNQDLPFPVILTGPKSASNYLQQLHDFIGATLGAAAQQRYRMIVNDPAEVAREMVIGIKAVRQFRRERNDAFHFNWLLKIDESFQHPFEPTHEAMAGLNLTREQPLHQLAANLRRAFSGIVAGNVKENGIRLIEEHGPYEIRGETTIMRPLDRLLQAFVEQHRMKLPGGSAYEPCYRVID